MLMKHQKLYFIDRDLYKQRDEKISVQLDEIKRKIEDAENSKKFLEQNKLSDKIKLKDFLGIQNDLSEDNKGAGTI